MAFLTTVITSCFPITNNQIRTSSNLRNQATIQDGRVTIQQVQGRQGKSFAGIGFKSNATSLVINKNRRNNAAFQARVVRCYNCQREGHMARQCTQPKWPRNLAWFKEKILLVQAHEAGQTDDLDAFDSDCTILEITQDNSILDNCVQEMYYSKQPTFNPASNIEITSDINIILYDQSSKETESAAVQNTASTEQQNVVIMSVFKEITNIVAKCNAEGIQNKNVSESLIAELERYKERKDQQIKPMLHDGAVISKKHDVIFVVDSEETLILSEESRSKMIEKQNDPVSKEKKVNISPINYSELNKLSGHFQKHFGSQKELSTEQAFWLMISNPMSKQLVVQPTPIKIDVPSELPKVSLVNKSFQKLQNHLAKFDKVVKERTTTSAITEGTWGFEHTKEVFITQVIPFLNSLRESFKDFDNGIHNELNEVKMVFNQIEAVVEQCSVDKKCFEI
ncbi:retrovirus-related pol polyprotein from transposon TNT 1-94 [Tanacetum coccineum]